MINKKDEKRVMYMSTERKFFFNNVEELIRYILEKKENVGQLRLQKTLYLLYAYYGATYGQMVSEDQKKESEIEFDYPEELFSADFEAWTYGPVIFEIYVNDKNGDYDSIDKLSKFNPEQPFEKDVLLFLDDIIEQINEMSDFTLVDRTHQDSSWINRYEPGQYRTKMNNEEIIKEYIEEYVS